MQVSIKLKGVEEALKTFDSKPVITAARRSLKETVASARTAASRAIRERYHISKVNIDRYLVKYLKATELIAILEARASTRTATLPLIYFRVKKPGLRLVKEKGKIKEIQKTRRAKGLVQVQVVKGKPWAPLKHAFIAKMPSGYIGIFERVGKERLPIRELKTIDVPLMFTQRNVMNTTIKRALEKWAKDFPARLDYLLKR